MKTTKKAYLGAARALTLLSLMGAVAVSPANAEDVSPEVGAVNALQAVFGQHAGMRANHAKGIVLEGTFTPTPEAAKLSKAALFAGREVKVTLRFSDPSGNPDIADNDPKANPHGLAVRYATTAGDMDTVMISARSFPFATAAEFRDFFIAVGSTKPDSPKPTPVEKFIGEHPVLAKWIGELPITPESLATESYYGLNAFRLIAKDGTVTNVRLRYVPVAGEKRLTPEDLKTKSATFLIDDIKERATSGNAKFKLVAQVGAKDDPTDSVIKVWPADRPLVTLGELSVTKPVDNSAEVEKQLVFMPTNLIDGIDASDDPLIASRAAAYAESFSRRSN